MSFATVLSQRPNKDLPNILHAFYSYFHVEIESVFAKSSKLKMKLKLKTLRRNIEFHFQEMDGMEHGMEWNDMEKVAFFTFFIRVLGLYLHSPPISQAGAANSMILVHPAL